MINSIKIQNFQSHKDTRLELDPGLNAIVGPSDCGKSVVFRALNWVINNRPSGNEFHSWWDGDPLVRIGIGKENITRSRNKSENLYTRGNQTFKAFGTNVPDEIQKALNISDINFQFQLDDPFLFGQTPGNIARKLNEVVDLAIIDKALFAINQRYRKESGDLANSQDKQKELSAELKEYDWLPKAEGCLVKLEAQSNQLGALKVNRGSLKTLIDEVEIIEESLKKEEETGALWFETQVNDLIKLDKEIDLNIKMSNDLEDLVEEIETLKKDIKNKSKFTKAEPEINKSIKLSTKIKKANCQSRLLDDLISDTSSLESRIKNKLKLLFNLTKEFLKAFPEECPLCGHYRGSN